MSKMTFPGPLRILVACDSFKDALMAEEVCRAIAKGLLHGGPAGLQVKEMPLSDGGEGILRILRRRLSLTSVNLEVADPLMRPAMASYGISADGTIALVEMAEASGLQRLAPGERDPLLTSTFGTGQLLADGGRRGVKRVLLSLGGSATNDAGIGAAAALGWKFLDGKGEAVAPIGMRLQDIVQIEPPGDMPFEEVVALCDVTNPLFGPNGAAFAYGRQKGGTQQSLGQLDAGLRHIAALVARLLGREDLAEIPGSGAAGGSGFGAIAFMNATLKRGIDAVLDLVRFDEAARQADLIITGEGRLDDQSAQGKLIEGVCRRAGRVPVIALCGIVSLSQSQVRAIGLRGAYSINPVEKPLPEMLAETAENLERSAAVLLRNVQKST